LDRLCILDFFEINGNSSSCENNIGGNIAFTAVLPDFSLHDKPKREKYTKRTENTPNDHNIYQMAVKQTKGPYNIPTLSISDCPKFTQNLDFGLKINHLATLIYGLDNNKLSRSSFC
jgi:hypothetical protein